MNTIPEHARLSTRTHHDQGHHYIEIRMELDGRHQFLTLECTKDPGTTKFAWGGGIAKTVEVVKRDWLAA